MALIIFDPAAFRAQFPVFTDPPYTNIILQGYFDWAATFAGQENSRCSGMTDAQRTLVLNLLTAHLITLMAQINAGSATKPVTPGFVQSATIDKVSVSMVAPPQTDSWSFWLNQTPYGQQLLAMLDLMSVGGFYYGGRAELGSLRRGPRTGCC